MTQKADDDTVESSATTHQRGTIMTNQDRDRYLAAMHSVQAGVALKMNWDPKETQPKSLGVGVTAAMVDTAALIRLLIEKKIFTRDEWDASLADQAEREVALYTAEVNKHYGPDSNITLH